MRLLNTSVIATNKEGEQTTYNTIEEASKATGLSTASIKSRCGRKGSGAKSKDGYTFIWADEKTRRARTAARSRQKGSSWELEIVHKLNEIGYTQCRSSRSINKVLDASKVDICDPSGDLPIHIQAKFTQTLPNFFKIKAEAPKDKPFCLFWKKASKDGGNSEGKVAIVDLNYFYKLITKK